MFDSHVYAYHRNHLLKSIQYLRKRGLVALVRAARFDMVRLRQGRRTGIHPFGSLMFFHVKRLYS
jgi:hypothetical protein